MASIRSRLDFATVLLALRLAVRERPDVGMIIKDCV